ncbi:hypothetical protein CVT25_009100 [Psilocybe cyanescens]|uniref:Uncharacterized protein n=1 Tax=Psilocybe cyanescens TaxID=93625 RepID=A0A409VNK1_PSICY|nr:hypothetical protein CVT25_009100 [Psilocybe cyanescens]
MGLAPSLGIFACIGDAIMGLVAMIAGCLECIIGSIAGFIATVVDCLTCGCCRWVLSKEYRKDVKLIIAIGLVEQGSRTEQLSWSRP